MLDTYRLDVFLGDLDKSISVLRTPLFCRIPLLGVDCPLCLLIQKSGRFLFGAVLRWTALALRLDLHHVFLVSLWCPYSHGTVGEVSMNLPVSWVDVGDHNRFAGPFKYAATDIAPAEENQFQFRTIDNRISPLVLFTVQGDESSLYIRAFHFRTCIVSEVSSRRTLHPRRHHRLLYVLFLLRLWSRTSRVLRALLRLYQTRLPWSDRLRHRYPW